MKKQIALLFLLAVCWSSGGATVYSHFCKGSNSSISSYLEIDHEEFELNCVKAKEVKKSCHQAEQEDPCCSDKVEFDTFEQIQPTTEIYSLTPLQNIIVVLPELVIIPSQKASTAYYNKPPPDFESRKSFLFHQFLC